MAKTVRAWTECYLHEWDTEEEARDCAYCKRVAEELPALMRDSWAHSARQRAWQEASRQREYPHRGLGEFANHV